MEAKTYIDCFVYRYLAFFMEEKISKQKFHNYEDVYWV